MVFFFFKQKTAYEITRRDWSSDVCSSDLASGLAPLLKWRRSSHGARFLLQYVKVMFERSEERRVGKECPCCVDLGGRRIIKKKKKIIKMSSLMYVNKIRTEVIRIEG